jgi:selenophosphate synthetase-related protein
LLEFLLITVSSIIYYRHIERSTRLEIQILFNRNLEQDQSQLLDDLPDAVVIANSDGIVYLNMEAWKLLKCQPKEKGEITLNDMDGVFCYDIGTCAIMSPVDQLIFFLTNID